jgi:hypothetical protein
MMAYVMYSLYRNLLWFLNFIWRGSGVLRKFSVRLVHLALETVQHESTNTPRLGKVVQFVQGVQTFLKPRTRAPPLRTHSEEGCTSPKSLIFTTITEFFLLNLYLFPHLPRGPPP